MKKYNYEEYEEDEHMVSNWEPMPFSIKDNYDYMCNNLILIIISNLLIFPIAIILIILDKILFGFKIFNSEKINHDEGFVSISNHIHYLDCSMIGLLYFPRRVHYPTLETNFKLPFIRHLIKLLYAMPIPNNSKQKKEFYKSINSGLKKGKIVHMYPEGSLWPYYKDVRHFKYGAFKMAVDANVCIQPTKFVFNKPKGVYKLYKRKDCIHAYVLDPIYPNNNLEYEERIEDLKERTYEAMKKEM